MINIKITSTGMYVPKKIESFKDLAPKLNVTEEWIKEKSGVYNRHIAEGERFKLDEGSDYMGAQAAKEALKGGSEPDLLINASTTQMQLIPDTSVFILKELGIKNIPSFSIHATCVSFLVALTNASALINSGLYKKILIVSSETPSVTRNFKEKGSAVLLGDGAAAAVVEPTPEGEDSALLGWNMRTWPEASHMTQIRVGVGHHPNHSDFTENDSLFHMLGRDIFKFTEKNTPPFFFQSLKDFGYPMRKIDVIIPHQASGPALDKMAEYLGKKKMINIVKDYGNTVAASIPMALAVAVKEGRVKRGNIVLLYGTAAGFHFGMTVLRW